MINIIEGSDEKIELTFTDSDDNAINIDNLDNAEIEICDGEVFKLYKLSGATANEGTINVIDANQGEVNFIIDRDFTKRYAGKKFDLIITLMLIDNSGEFKDNIRYSKTEFERFIKIERVCK